MSFQTYLMKYIFAAGDRQRDKHFVYPSDVQRFEGIHYVEKNQSISTCPVQLKADKWTTLDVYAPKTAAASGSAAKLPIIVNVHGGGFMSGSRHSYRAYGTLLAQRGFVVVNYSYHLAPRFQYPTPLYETNQVMHWIRQHIAAYGGDLSQLFMVGDSAGAQLAAQYLTVLTNPEYARYFNMVLPPVQVKGVCLNCGSYDQSPKGQAGAEAGRLDTGKLMQDYLGKHLCSPDATEEELRPLSVSPFVTADFPPAFVMTAEHDFLKAAARPFADRLESVGVPVIYRCYGEGEDEPLYRHVFHLNWSFVPSVQANDDECDFFRSLM